jgi:hypothetical protein
MHSFLVYVIGMSFYVLLLYSRILEYVNIKLEGMWKEVAITNLHSTVGTDEHNEKPVKISSLPAEVWNLYFKNTQHEWYLVECDSHKYLRC